MDTLDILYGTASGFAGILALLANELVLGLGVAIALIVWLVAGDRDDEADNHHHPRRL